jgi:hypothetical protein
VRKPYIGILRNVRFVVAGQCIERLPFPVFDFLSDNPAEDIRSVSEETGWGIVQCKVEVVHQLSQPSAPVFGDDPVMDEAHFARPIY